MTGTKRHLPILLLSLVVVCSTTLAAEEGNSSFPGHIGMLNPCNGAVVIVDGTNFVRVHENTREHDDAHITIHMRFVGSGQDESGSPYRTVLVAKGKFQADAPSYDVHYTSMWVGQNGAPSFSMDGTLRVWMQSGLAQATNIMDFNTVCRKDAKSDDDDDSEDHDRDSHEERDRDSH